MVIYDHQRYIGVTTGTGGRNKSAMRVTTGGTTSVVGTDDGLVLDEETDRRMAVVRTLAGLRVVALRV
jgi:hypothetical protein